VVALWRAANAFVMWVRPFVTVNAPFFVALTLIQ
jgi:hypothetical protein